MTKTSFGCWQRAIAPLLHWNRRLGVLIGLSIVMAAVSVVGPLLVRQIIDGALPKRRLDELVWLTSALAVVAIVQLIGNIVRGQLVARVAGTITRDFRTRLLFHLQMMPEQVLLQHRPGALINHIMIDLDDIKDFYYDILTVLLVTGLDAVIAIAVMVRLNLLLTTVVLGLGSLLVIPGWLFAARVYASQAEFAHKRDIVTSLAAQMLSISGSTLVKLFAQHDHERERIQRAGHSLLQAHLRSLLVTRLAFVPLGIVIGIAPAAIWLIGGKVILSGAVTVGTLVAFIAFISKVYAPLRLVTDLQVGLANMTALFQRLFDVLDRSDGIAVSGTRTLRAVTHGIHIEDVRFAYPEGIPVLAGATLSIAARQTTGIVGATGSGKSTLARLLVRLHDAQGGRVSIDGYDIRAYDVAELRRRVTVVSQDPFLLHDTIEANIRYGRPDASDEALHDALAVTQLDAVIARMPDGLSTIIGERGLRLSGGERQQIAIARAILARPDVLVLDEATSALDADTEDAILQRLSGRLNRMTCVVIAHRLASVRHADRIYVLDRGRIQSAGTHAELVQGGELYARPAAVQDFRFGANAS